MILLLNTMKVPVFILSTREVLRRRETEKICGRRKVERRNSIFVRHISGNGGSRHKSIWIKRDAETW